MRGFIVGGEGGSVVMYERVDENGQGQMISGVQAIKTDVFRKSKDLNVNDELCRVTNISLTQNEDVLICTTEKNQIFSIVLSNTDVKVCNVFNPRPRM
jgi:ATP:corrinoid adenosyltransferase